MQIVSLADNLHEMSNQFSGEKKQQILSAEFFTQWTKC